MAHRGRAGVEARSGMRRWWQLVVICALVNLVETVAVMLADPGARPQLAAQASAVSPWGLFSDLRWLVVFNTSWLQMATLLGGIVVARSALNALMTSLAWPDNVTRPAPGRLFFRSVYGTVFMAALLAAPVTVMFGAAAVPVSWLFFAGVPTVLVLALVAHPIGLSADWWRRPFSYKGAAWMGLSFGALSLCGLAMSAAPAALWPVIAVLAGTFNAWAWVGTVHATIDRPLPHHIVPAVPAALVAFAGAIALFTTLGFAGAGPAPFAPLPSASRATSSGGPGLLVVSGYGSLWDGSRDHPVPGFFDEQRFSYKGLYGDGEPMPYRPSDTVKPIAQLDRLFLAQVAELARRSGRRVAVVAESEGALVAKTALLASPDAPVSALVLVSPLQGPARVHYTLDGRDGWGMVSASAMQVLTSALGSASPIDLSPGNAFLKSLEADAPSITTAMACPLHDLRQMAVLPLADATVSPLSPALQYPAIVIPAFHGGVTASPQGGRLIATLLSGRLPGDGVLAAAEQTISYASQAWQVPTLPGTEFPGASTPARTSSAIAASCATASHQLRAKLLTAEHLRVTPPSHSRRSQTERHRIQHFFDGHFALMGA